MAIKREGGFIMARKGIAAVVISFFIAFVVIALGRNPVQAKEELLLKVANYIPPTSPQSMLIEDFCRELERRTGGRIKVDHYAGGSLLKAPAIFEGVVTGIADIGYSHIYYTPGKMPVTEAVGLPLGYTSVWVSSHVLNDFYREFRPKEFDQVVVLFMNTSSPSAILTTKKKITKLEDLKGLTLRAPGVAGEVVKALGATPAPTPMPEVYDALVKGVLDGDVSNFETLRSFRFGEVVKYVTSIWQVTHPYPFYFIMNKKSYERIPADLKPIFDELVGEYNELFMLRWNSNEFEGMKFAKEHGVDFYWLPEEEAKRWVEAVQPVIEDYVKRMVSKGYSENEVRGWLNFIRERIDYWTKKQIELHIPSPAGPPELRPEKLVMVK